MITGFRRLIEAGFANKKFKEEYSAFYSFSEPKQKKILDEIEKKNKILDYCDNDEFEIVKDQIMQVPYPKPANRYVLVYESPHQSVEPLYFQCLSFLSMDWGFPIIDKVTDIFTAAEHSSFYGAAAQRLGLAQDKVSQYLATIGQFIRRDLFQLVRDLRWIDERIDIHKRARLKKDSGALKDESAEVTLKGIWTDIVDGVVQGQRVSANIFQMAQQLQFTTLPDWFFATHPQSKDEIDPMAARIETTQVVKNVLKRKLQDFLTWKEYNFKELLTRRKFELMYLKQNYNIILLYMQWIRPYMKHIEKLSGDISKAGVPELIASFEGSMIEIEILARKLEQGHNDIYTCILETFEYRTRPSLSFTQEAGFHRGPVHVGETKITWRAYAWSEKQIEAFKEMKAKDDMDTLRRIDSSVNATMDAIGDDFDAYLKEAEGVKEEKIEGDVAKRPSVLEPLLLPLKGFMEIFEPLVKPFTKTSEKKKAQANEEKRKKEAEKAAESAGKILWQNYKNFKKRYGMLTW